MPYSKCENHYKLHKHAPKLVLLHRGFVALYGACAVGILCRTHRSALVTTTFAMRLVMLLSQFSRTNQNMVTYFCIVFVVYW